MSFSAFYSGLAGLQANSGRLGVVGNNLANVNTIGFKASRVTFADVFSGATGGATFNGAGNPMQVGRGVSTSAVDQLFSQGSLQTTNLVTDLSIQGNGFFVLEDANVGRSYSRAGNFTFDKDGFLVGAGGQRVQGFTQPDANGQIPPSGVLTDIQIPLGLQAPPQATQNLTLMLNLSASARVDDPATAQNEAQPFTSTLTVYDSLGSRHNLTFTFTPVDTDANGVRDAWTYEVTGLGDEVAGGTPGTPVVLATGTMDFDAQGRLTTPAANVAIAIPGWQNGGAAQNVTWNLYDMNNVGNVTGYAADSASTSSSQDGYGVGTLRTLSVDPSGLFSGVFTNGVTLELARVGLASFNNANGLVRNGQNTFIETNSSGAATIGGANQGGRGAVSSNSLELSNVDMTTEFTELIISERGYQANSRIITTTDSVIQEALNLKR